MTVFGDLRAEWAGKLVAAGVAIATTDPNANVPFVLVEPITLGAPQGVGAWTGTLTITIAVPPPGDADAMAALEELLQLVVTTHPAPTSAVPTTYSQRELPAYTVTYPVTVPNPNC